MWHLWISVHGGIDWGGETNVLAPPVIWHARSQTLLGQRALVYCTPELASMPTGVLQVFCFGIPRFSLRGHPTFCQIFHLPLQQRLPRVSALHGPLPQ